MFDRVAQTSAYTVLAQNFGREMGISEAEAKQREESMKFSSDA